MNNKSSKVSETQKHLADEIKLQIRKGLFEDLPIGEAANSVGISRWHMIRVFKNVTGMTPMEYKNALRLAMAKNLLENTDMSISDIGAACGFASTTYFSHRFKTAVGISPLAYKRKAAENKKGLLQVF